MTGMINTLMAFPSRALSTKGLIIYPDAATQALTAAEIIDWAVTENAGEHLPLGGASASTVRLRLDNRAGEWKPGGSILGVHTLDGAVIGIEIGAQHPEYSGSYDTIDGGLPTATYANTADGGSPGSSFSDVIDGGIPFNFPHVEWYWTRIGEYVVEKPKLTEMVVELAGSDYLANRAKKAFSDGLTYPRTVSQILQSACSQADITLKSASFPNASVNIPVKPLWDENTTCRDVISYVACVAGGFARIDRAGMLEIVPFDDTNDYSIGTDRYIDLERKTTFGSLNALTVFPHGTKENAVRVATDIGLEDTDQNSIAVQGNPLLRYESAALTPLITGMFSVLGGLAFESAKVIWQGDPTLAVGDVLTVTDKGGSTCPILVLGQVMTFASGFGMTSENNMRTATSGAARNMRIFTPSGRLNATALEGDINIKAGENLNLMADSDINVNAGANVNVNAGANVKVKAGGSLKLEAAADMDITGASVNIQTDEFGIKNANGESLLGISSPSGGDPGGQMVLGSEKMPIKIGGNFVLPVENGGTGISGQTNKTHYFASYPNDLIGVDGDLGVLVNMASGVYSAITPAHHTAVTGVAVFCGMSRNWNAINPGGWTAAGNANAAGSANLYASAWSFMFSDPDIMGRISINFEAGKFIGGEWYGWSVSSYLTVAIANAAGVILGSTTFVPPVNQSAFGVNIEAALEDDTTYYILMYDNTTSANKSKALINVASVTSPAYSAGGYNCGLFVKHGGNWTLLASGSG
jgi:hypothetical protein